ncbi:MAG: DNA gyrase subunit A, partial [Nitrospinota bacterium]
TEARMTALAEEMLRDIDKETVDFVPNYDGTRQEPVVLPARVPNLLVNGASGIAVGMATNIPPHNLGEGVDALVLLLEKPGATLEELMAVLPGPDFPTGGIVVGREGIREAYATGRGSLQLRARAFVERHPRTGRESIVISEIPYQVNKAKLVEKIAELVQERQLEGVADVRDESDREGMRIVVELKRDETAGPILNALYKHTQMQVTFGVISLALVDNQPRVLGLRELLESFLRFRREVILRRSRYELRQAEHRVHIVAGLRTALAQIDAVIALIRASRTPEEARGGLVARFKLSAPQAQAILEMRLQRLTALERSKLDEEHAELQKTIAHLRRVLAEEPLQRQIIREELLELKEKYGDARRTEIQDAAADIALEDTVVEEDMVVTISHTGFIKRNPVTLFRIQRRGGKGVRGVGTREEDYVEQLFVASSRDLILFFTNTGRCHWLKVYQLPQGGRAARGRAIVNLLQLSSGEHVTAALPVRRFEPDRFLLVATKKGVLKKTELAAFSRPRAGGVIALRLDEGDELIAVRQTDGSREVFLGTRKGMAVRFKESEVRPTGRGARGVAGVRLDPGDEVVGVEVVTAGHTILTATERGLAKRTELEEYRLIRRGGKGVINLRVTPRTGPVVGLRQVYVDDEIIVITGEGQIVRVWVKDIPVLGRNAQGVRLIGLDEGDRVVGIARLEEAEEQSPPGAEGEGDDAGG